ncbi:MAG TPA: peptide-methionine (S)-S-oxide reductase, partial [Brevibacterium sp.]|nr:peptide-methionine (S)-S-oxide reductase [Brevibacterium sp.]
MQTLTLGAGCFWCLDAVYQRTHGVSSVVSGYTGGHVDHPTYEQVCAGTTGHAEALQVTFDPEI